MGKVARKQKVRPSRTAQTSPTAHAADNHALKDYVGGLERTCMSRAMSDSRGGVACGAGKHIRASFKLFGDALDPQEN